MPLQPTLLMNSLSLLISLLIFPVLTFLWKITLGGQTLWVSIYVASEWLQRHNPCLIVTAADFCHRAGFVILGSKVATSQRCPIMPTLNGGCGFSQGFSLYKGMLPV